MSKRSGIKSFAGKRPEAVGGIELRGSDEFLIRTKEALCMLRSVPHFSFIRTDLAVIRQGQRSGMKAWLPKPMFIVGAATWKHSTLWYAGAIAHDAYHAKLYREAKSGGGGVEPAADSWTGADAERQCLAFQKQVLVQLGADAKMIAYIERCAEKPTYQGANKGWRSWLDYARRWW